MDLVCPKDAAFDCPHLARLRAIANPKRCPRDISWSPALEAAMRAKQITKQTKKGEEYLEAQNKIMALVEQIPKLKHFHQLELTAQATGTQLNAGERVRRYLDLLVCLGFLQKKYNQGKPGHTYWRPYAKRETCEYLDRENGTCLFFKKPQDEAQYDAP